MKYFFLLITPLILLCNNCWADTHEKLWVVAQVSKTGRSFVVRRGGEDQIVIGQEGFFSNSDVRFRAQAVEVSRYLSLWKIFETKSQVPFKKGELIQFSHATQDMDAQIVEVSSSNFKQKENSEKENFWKIKLGGSLTLSEAQTNQNNSDTSRKGFSFEGYRQHTLTPNWSFSYGLRIDSDSYTDPTYLSSATSTRYLAVAEVNYLFDQFSSAGNYYYAGFGLGYGPSSSSVEGSTATGTTLLLPSVKLGYLGKWGKETKWLVEGAVESLSQSESYIDTGSQKAQLINTKINLGLMF